MFATFSVCGACVRTWNENFYMIFEWTIHWEPFLRFRAAFSEHLAIETRRTIDSIKCSQTQFISNGSSRQQQQENQKRKENSVYPAGFERSIRFFLMQAQMCVCVRVVCARILFEKVPPINLYTTCTTQCIIHYATLSIYRVSAIQFQLLYYIYKIRLFSSRSSSTFNYSPVIVLFFCWFMSPNTDTESETEK